jgi:hypothetical protein
MSSNLGFRSILGGLVTLMVIIAVGTAVASIFGGPYSPRQLRLDERRVNDLERIRSAVQIYTQNQEPDALPPSLGILGQSPGWSHILTMQDPETGLPYEYRPIDTRTFEVCATFTTDAATAASGRGIAIPPKGIQPPIGWHGSGRQCFASTASP